jgi:hypothetical protein
MPVEPAAPRRPRHRWPKIEKSGPLLAVLCPFFSTASLHGRTERELRSVTVTFRREPPDVEALLEVLSRHEVEFVVTGSAAAALLGIPLDPGDLDITPATDRANLVRLATALDEIEARQYPDEPFVRWEEGGDWDGGGRWTPFEPTPEDRRAREDWRPDPDELDSFDHLLASHYGSVDVVPKLAGRHEVLRPSAVAVTVNGHRVWVESIADQLSTLTVPRREKDGSRVKALRALQRATAVERLPRQ